MACFVGWLIGWLADWEVGWLASWLDPFNEIRLPYSNHTFNSQSAIFPCYFSYFATNACPFDSILLSSFPFWLHFDPVSLPFWDCSDWLSMFVSSTKVSQLVLFSLCGPPGHQMQIPSSHCIQLARCSHSSSTRRPPSLQTWAIGGLFPFCSICLWWEQIDSLVP